MGKKQVQALEDVLGSACVALPSDRGDVHHFYTEMYPYLVSRYEDAKPDVAKLGLTELVETAIRECLELSKRGERKAAGDLLMNASFVLSERSGTHDDMRRMYTASNDPQTRQK